MSSASSSLWTLLSALLATHLASMGAFIAVPVLAPLIAAETGLPPSLAGVHTALVYGGATIAAPVGGALLHRLGGIRVCQAGLLLLSAGLALAVLGHPLALAVSAVVSGLGYGPVTPSGSHLLAGRVPRRQWSLVFSIKQTGVPAGAALIAALAPAVAAATGSWRAGVLTVAGLGLATALALQPLRGRFDAERLGPGRGAGGVLGPGGIGGVFREAVANLGLLRTERGLRAVGTMSALYGVSQFCFSTFFVVWQVETLGTPLPEAGLRLALAQGAGVVGRVFWGMVADRLGAVRVMAGLGLGAAAAGLALALAGPGWPGAAVALVGMAMGATAIGWNGVMLAEVARRAPEGRVGAATAAMNVLFSLTMLVAPTGFSALVGLTGGYATGFLLCAATALAGVAALRGTRPR